jgi:hypothetical protein
MDVWLDSRRARQDIEYAEWYVAATTLDIYTWVSAAYIYAHRLFKTGAYSDITIKGYSRNWRLHKCILSRFSWFEHLEVGFWR